MIFFITLMDRKGHALESPGDASRNRQKRARRFQADLRGYSRGSGSAHLTPRLPSYARESRLEWVKDPRSTKSARRLPTERRPRLSPRGVPWRPVVRGGHGVRRRGRSLGGVVNEAVTVEVLARLRRSGLMAPHGVVPVLPAARRDRGPRLVPARCCRTNVVRVY